jgi:hypothetical protein
MRHTVLAYAIGLLAGAAGAFTAMRDSWSDLARSILPGMAIGTLAALAVIARRDARRRSDQWRDPRRSRAMDSVEQEEARSSGGA